MVLRMILAQTASQRLSVHRMPDDVAIPLTLPGIGPAEEAEFLAATPGQKP